MTTQETLMERCRHLLEVSEKAIEALQAYQDAARQLSDEFPSRPGVDSWIDDHMIDASRAMDVLECGQSDPDLPDLEDLLPTLWPLED